MPNTQSGSLYNSKVFYSPGTLRTYVSALLDMFNDINVRRYEKDFVTVKKIIHVPIQYGNLTKTFMERKEDATHEGGDRYYQQVPRMAILLTDMTRAPERAKSTNETRDLTGHVSADDPESFYNDYEPTPYTYTFSLRMRTRSTEDAQQIIEQIMPFFNPELHLRVKELPFINIERSIQVDADLSLDWKDELDTSSVRVLDNTINLTVHGFLYRPITSKPMLKMIYRYLAHINDDGSTTQDRVSRTYMAITESEIPEDAVSSRYIENGDYYLYEIIDNEEVDE